MISTANITMQFGSKPLFENVSVKFNNGNRYGLIGANGCGKSTFMKILGGDLEPSAGQVMLEPNTRLGKLRQDQFAYEEFTVIDTVIMGHGQLWKVKAERDRIYSLPEMTEEDGMAVAELETEFAEMDGYTAESRAGELLLGLGIPLDQHFGPMSEVAPGWKLRCWWRTKLPWARSIAPSPVASTPPRTRRSVSATGCARFCCKPIAPTRRLKNSNPSCSCVPGI
ncbi:ATP-binding cassette protein, ChvD family [compost metagenome]